jgi:hypothetical protein
MRLMDLMAMSLVLSLACGGGTAGAQEALTVAGHEVSVTGMESGAGTGNAALLVDGKVLHEDGVIYLDPEPRVVGGVTVVTGVAGVGGNACNAAPFVLVLPEGAAPELFGPVASCAYLPLVEVQPEAIVFAADPVPSQPGEVWVWNRTTGFTEALPEPFAPDAGSGWELLDRLDIAHPVEVLEIAPVYAMLEAGLGPADWAAFSERISGLGSGSRTGEGYLGSACLKLTCEADWAILYLHVATRQAFAIWHVRGEIENRIWPEDTNLWPAEAMTVLRGSAGE